MKFNSHSLTILALSLSYLLSPTTSFSPASISSFHSSILSGRKHQTSCHQIIPHSHVDTLLRYQNRSDVEIQTTPKNPTRKRIEQVDDMKRMILEDSTRTDDETEGKYGVGVLEKLQRPEKVLGYETMRKEDMTKLEKQIERAVKQRPYPLFMLEKAALVLDDTVAGISHLVSDINLSSEEARKDCTANGEPLTKKKERIVVLGSGWGSAAFLKQIDTEMFDVTVISPRNYFLFTPMLAGASVGTVEYRSITLPIRQINPNVKYLEAVATAIDPKTSKVSCTSVVNERNSFNVQDFEVEYDRLLVAVGAKTSTFGVPGVQENCYFLKQVEDAREIRKAIVNLFESANLPGLTDEERQNILTFAIIGAGPSGVEFAGELRDFIEEDGPRYYPELLRHVRIKIFEHSNSVLRPFGVSLQEAAIKKLTRAIDIKDKKVLDLLPQNFTLIEIFLEKGVQEVKENSLVLKDGSEVPCGLCVWAAGNGPLPITLQLIDALGEKQAALQSAARGKTAVDMWLRAIGGEGKVFALGDCSCFGCMKMGQMPATAQVAAQQAEHLARLLAQSDMDVKYEGEDDILLPPVKRKDRTQTIAETISTIAMNNNKFAAPFQFHDMGILAYIGGQTALAQLKLMPEKSNIDIKGRLGFGVWQSVYISKQASWKNRVLVLVDWMKAKVFGRDITKV